VTFAVVESDEGRGMEDVGRVRLNEAPRLSRGIYMRSRRSRQWQTNGPEEASREEAVSHKIATFPEMVDGLDGLNIIIESADVIEAIATEF
jgi:hypothetical protein